VASAVQHTYIYIGLQSYGEFQIDVAAQTSVGTGQYTQASVVRTLEDGKTKYIRLYADQSHCCGCRFNQFFFQLYLLLLVIQ